MACDSSGFILLQIRDLVYSHRATCRGSNPLPFKIFFLDYLQILLDLLAVGRNT